ncbi:hypothetical protein EYF80_047807 [Liparis tanakae]|uniref:Uncharacterized protein n=1 Tax=Liparis tanakae TaxID=230148 RepID=A0A4Z2FMN6_9TELE|nr:hypothetical protein EYF80_047807 [Liparis tanakae]
MSWLRHPHRGEIKRSPGVLLSTRTMATLHAMVRFPACPLLKQRLHRESVCHRLLSVWIRADGDREEEWAESQHGLAASW